MRNPDARFNAVLRAYEDLAKLQGSTSKAKRKATGIFVSKVNNYFYGYKSTTPLTEDDKKIAGLIADVLSGRLSWQPRPKLRMRLEGHLQVLDKASQPDVTPRTATKNKAYGKAAPAVDQRYDDHQHPWWDSERELVDFDTPNFGASDALGEVDPEVRYGL